MESITVRLQLKDLRQDLVINLECKPSRRHQAMRQCRFWRSTARIRGGKSIGGNSPVATNPASKRFQYGGIVADR